MADNPKKLSVRDKFAVHTMRRFLNFNPEKKDRIVKKFKRLERIGRFTLYRLRRGFERTDYNADGVPIEFYKPKGAQPKKVVLVVHGGGFIMGLINVYRNLHKAYSDAANGAAVAVVDYRTAPQFTYPAAHDDVYSAYEFLLGLGYAAGDIVLVGDSAGGNLVLSLLLKLKDAGQALPAAAAVISPWTDLNASGASYRENYNKDVVFGRKKGVFCEEKFANFLNCGIFSYAADADRNDPYLSPVYGAYGGMPPILITVGEHEMILDDSLTVAQKIEQAGSSVKLIVGSGMFHNYPLRYKLSPIAKSAFNEILNFLTEHTAE